MLKDQIYMVWDVATGQPVGIADTTPAMVALTRGCAIEPLIDPRDL